MNKLNLMVTAILATLVLAMLAGCGGQAAAPGALRQLAAVQLLSLGGEKQASTPPTGIYVTWSRSGSALAAGYYLYRDTDHIPDPPPDETIDPALRTNGGNLIPQPDSGATVTFDDIFPVIVDQTYYYRVTVVDNLGNESYPSNEMSWTVHGQHLSGFSPASAYWGDKVTLDGDTFGSTYDPATDGVLFADHLGGQIEGAIVSWSPTQIEVTVPAGAATGRVTVVINGALAQTDSDLNVLNAYIAGISPEPGFVEQPLTVNGENFGASQSSSSVTIAGANVTSAVTAWSDWQITLTVPPATVRGDVVVTVADHPSNGVTFTPRAEIQSADTLSAQAGESVRLRGRFFGSQEGVVRLDNSAELTVTAWNDKYVYVDIAGAVGPHTLTLSTKDSVQSNDFAFTIVDPLSISMAGITAGAVYRPSSPPQILITTASDADRVDLLIDGKEVNESTTAPFTLIFDPAPFRNGFHQVRVVAHRRAVSATSTGVGVVVFSLPGDVNADGTVDMDDRVMLEGLIGMSALSPNFRAWYDGLEDGLINEADQAAIGYYFGMSQ